MVASRVGQLHVCKDCETANNAAMINLNPWTPVTLQGVLVDGDGVLVAERCDRGAGGRGKISA